MQQPIGEYIRQLRRQRSLTQTKLGGERFSKSYVSAVERDKILPSREALRFFAEQLEQPADYFEQLLQQTEMAKQISVPGGYAYKGNDWQELEATPLLDLVLDGAEFYPFALPRNLETFSSGKLAVLPLQKQARYAFLQGLAAQQREDFPAALPALEYALALAPEKYQPAILDALGTNYYLSGESQSALGYHKRALVMLQERSEQENASDLLLLIELHCANDYSAQGMYELASGHYEHARLYLRKTHNMHTAGQLYKGLGYSMYAALYQELAMMKPAALQEAHEQIEQRFQYALGYLLQSRSVYQASHDSRAESQLRLLHVMVLLDFGTFRRRISQQRASQVDVATPIYTTDILNEAEEQCRQIILAWQSSTEETPPQPGQENDLYVALAYLIRIYVQRSIVARMSGSSDTALHARSLASYLSRLALKGLAENCLSGETLQSVLSLRASDLTYNTPSLPHAPNLPCASEVAGRLQGYRSYAEIYFAIGELVEELGRAATTPDYAHDCFQRANEYLFASVKMARQAFPDKEHDPGYLVRGCQRCIALFEERIRCVPDEAGEVISTLLALLKEELHLAEFPGL